MTAAPAHTVPAQARPPRGEAPRRAPKPPQLTLIDGIPRVRHVPIVVVCGFLLLTGLLTVLVLNAALAQDSYEVRDMRKASAVLADAQEALREQIRNEQAPGQIEAFARSQGMRTATVGAYINVVNGAVYGTPRAAKDPEATPEVPKPAVRPAKPAASPTAIVRSPQASATRPSGAPSKATASAGSRPSPRASR